MHELPETLRGLQHAFEAGHFSPAEAIGMQRKRILDQDRRFHNVIQMLPDAVQSTSARSGPLSGVGLAHKDIFNTDGRRPGAGHDGGADSVGLRAAPVVASLESAGASTLATLCMAEYACGATGENTAFAGCINPLNEDAVVGGSSSGSAVAVCAGMVYASLGTDTAGSVRIPAATCAVLGLKTTHGLVSLEGVYPLAPSLDSVGILARSAGDLHELLSCITRAGVLRPTPVAPLRLKAWLPETGLDTSVAEALEKFLCESSCGERLSVLPEHDTLTLLAEIVMHTEAAKTHRDALLDCTLSPSVEAVALAGLVIPPKWYEAAINDRSRHAIDFANKHFESHDLLLLPALPRTLPNWNQVVASSPEFDVKQLLALHRYMGFVNYLGFPSLVFPIARDARGLPISVQVLARPFHEADLLAFAEKIELDRHSGNGFTESFLNQG